MAGKLMYISNHDWTLNLMNQKIKNSIKISELMSQQIRKRYYGMVWYLLIPLTNIIWNKYKYITNI